MIRRYVNKFLKKVKLALKKDYRVHPTLCGVDVLGYIVSKAKVKIRHNIKNNMIKTYSDKNAPSYDGILGHCDGENLKQKLKRRLK